MSRSASRQRSTKETTVAVTIDLDGTGRDRRVDRPARSTTTCSTSSAATAASTSSVRRRPATCTSTATTPWRTRPSSWARRSARRSATRPACGASPAACTRSTRRSWRWRSTCRVARSWCGRSSCPRPSPSARPPFDPSLAEHAITSFATAAGITLHVTLAAGPQRPPHHRGQLQGPGPLPARRRARRGRRRAEHQGRAVTADRPLVAVLDYGIGNLRSAQKALEQRGRRRPSHRRSGVIADAAGVVLPGVGAFGALCRGVARRRARGGRPRCGGRRAGRSSASASACSCCSTLRGGRRCHGPGRDPRGRALDPARREAAPDAVEHVARCDDRTIRCFAGLGAAPWMYFVHSLHGVPDDAASVAATCEYGGPISPPPSDAGQRVRHAVPPGEVGDGRPGAAGQLHSRGGRARALLIVRR